ncbi:MAG TPA: hypothetical protein VHV82_02840 [Sporichthyaceae bacterium]|jgi:hypothetical protein|nr:hypothetical protein [Sporichthyaceae bacterium]
MVPSDTHRDPSGRRLRLAAALAVIAALIDSGEPAFAVETPPSPASSSTPSSSSAGAPVIESVSVAPQDVVLAGPKNHSAGVRVRMRITDPDGVDSAFAGLFGPKSENGRAFRLKRVSGSKRDGIWQAKGGLPASATPGAWRVQGFAVDTTQHSSDADEIYGGFVVRDSTRFDEFTVTRSPSGLELRATLRRWDGQNWVAVAAGAVDVQFRAANTAGYGTVGSVHTGPDGTVVAAAHDGVTDGTWRLSYAGDELRAPATSTDATVAPPSPSPTAAPDAQPASTASPPPVPSAEPTPQDEATEATEATAEPTVRPGAPTRAAPTARPIATARPITTARPVATARPTATTGPATTARPAQTVRSTPQATGRPAQGPAGTATPMPKVSPTPKVSPASSADPDPTPAALPPRAPGHHWGRRRVSRP